LAPINGDREFQSWESPSLGEVELGGIDCLLDVEFLEFVVGEISEFIDSHSEGEIFCIVFLDESEVVCKDSLSLGEIDDVFVGLSVLCSPFVEIGSCKCCSDEDEENKDDFHFVYF